MNEARMSLSIAYAKGDRRWVRLDEVIETADGLEHLIPMPEELDEGSRSSGPAGRHGWRAQEPILSDESAPPDRGSHGLRQRRGMTMVAAAVLPDGGDTPQTASRPEQP